MKFAIDQHGAIVRMDGDKSERIATSHNGRQGAQQLVDRANANDATADLLAALQKVANWYGEFPGSACTEMSIEEQRDFMRGIARAAIAKATQS